MRGSRGFYQLARLCTCAIIFAAANVSAQEQRPAVLEEILVTAQLREQRLQDVPVSVSTISGSKIMEAGIHKMEDLQAYVPNLTMTETGIGTQLYIRGIGSGINQGFEQSVGMFVDGVYYGRAQLARAPFLDLQRVEVLRGPQNILYGKNSVAGAVSVITANPTSEHEGSVSLLNAPKFGEQIADVVISGPVTDNLGFRFASRFRRHGGFMKNLTLDRYEPALDEQTARLKLLWSARDNLDVGFKVELGRFNVVGRQAEIINDEPSISDNPIFAGRTHAEILHRTEFPEGSGAILDIESDDSVLNNFQDFKRSSNGDFSNNKTANLTFNVDWTSGTHNFSSVTAFMAYEYDDLCDCDFTGAEGFKLILQEDYKQYSQEFRWISPAGETLEFIGGAYFQHSELEFFDSIIVDSDLIVQLLNAADAAEGCQRGDFDPDPTATEPEEIAGCGNAGNSIANLTSPRNYTNDSTLFSGFLQTTWNITSALRLTAGGRYSLERKKGRRHLTFGDLDFNERPISQTDTVAAISFGTERHDLRGSRRESRFAPLINLQYDLTPDMMVYASASRGFKAGGFDARSNATPSDEPTPANPDATIPNQTVLIGAFEYEEEIATSFEAGFKSTLFGGRAEINAALFRTEYDDMQVSIFDGTLGFNVGNAASAVVQGLEIDGRVQLTQYLMLAGSLAFLDFEFKDFQNGQCLQGQEPTSPDGINCDYSGKTNQYVADYSGALLLSYTRPITQRLGLGIAVDAIFTDEYNPSQNLDPTVQQDGYIKYNGRITLAAIDRSWEVALVGKNLSNEVIIPYANDTPTSFTIFGAKSHFAFLEAPRSVGLHMTYRWR